MGPFRLRRAFSYSFLLCNPAYLTIYGFMPLMFVVIESLPRQVFLRYIQGVFTNENDESE
jgi:hypothetical protein